MTDLPPACGGSNFPSLTGTTGASEDEALEVAELRIGDLTPERAKNLRPRIAKAFGIDPSRITIEAVTGGGDA